MSLVPYQHPRRVVPRRSATTQVHAAFPFAAPNGGLDVTQPLPGGDPRFAIQLDNLIPRVWGCELRGGYLQWVDGLGGEVRTLMSYQPSSIFGGGRLFAGVSNGDVVDVTSPDTSPTPEFTTTEGDVDGEWYFTNFSNLAGNFLCMVCAGAGYWTFDGSTWTQQTVTEITGADPADFAYVFSWKNRLWFVERDSNTAWYLPVGQIIGEVKAFDFGPLMANGGSLQVGTGWTMDGGEGMDDKLVMIGSEGDVLLYEGTDPDVAESFRMVGRWFIGRVPSGRRFISQYASDLAIVCERGMVFMSELMRGQGFFANAALAKRVNSEMAKQAAGSLRRSYWEVKFVPHDQVILVNTPDQAGKHRIWVYEVNTQAWCTFSEMPANTVQSFQGQPYFGDVDGTVWRMLEGDSDGATDVPGKDLEGTVLTMFQPLGEGMRKKRFLMVNATFISSSAPSVKVAMNSQWDFGDPGVAPGYSKGGDSLWDNANWDESVWSGSTQTYQGWAGVTGFGNYGALAMRVRGRAGTIFASWTALVEQGGIL